MWNKRKKYWKVSIRQCSRKQSNGNIIWKALTPPFLFIQPICLSCHLACFSPPLSPSLLTHPVLVLPPPIAQSYLRLAVSRTCRKDKGIVNMYRWCWMIGRWWRSVLLEAWSMASRRADQHLSTKQKNKNKNNIWTWTKGRAQEHGAWRRVSTLYMLVRHNDVWQWPNSLLGHYVRTTTPTAPDSFSHYWWMATCLSDELSREHAWRLNSPY